MKVRRVQDRGIGRLVHPEAQGRRQRAGQSGICYQGRRGRQQLCQYAHHLLQRPERVQGREVVLQRRS